jgi:GNAT superfamily N-acetyltransferase
MEITQAASPFEIEQCIQLAKSLPAYFSDSAIIEMAHDFQHHDLYIARGDQQVVGLISICRKNYLVAEISWLAVAEDHHRSGIGTLLLQTAVQQLRQDQFQLLEVKTLAESVDYEPYVRTHRFYQKHQFISLEIIHPYPGWDDECPCQIYVKLLK